MDSRTSNKAACNGHLNCLKYAHLDGCLLRNECEEAAKNGHLNCMKFVYENGCQWDKSICAYIAQNCHIDCLKYAHEKGAPWSSNTCFIATLNGHLECLKYASKNGCQLDPMRSKTILKWISLLKKVHQHQNDMIRHEEDLEYKFIDQTKRHFLTN